MAQPNEKTRGTDVTTDARQYFVTVHARLVSRYGPRARTDAVDIVQDVALVLWKPNYRLFFTGPANEHAAFVHAAVARLCHFSFVNHLRTLYRRAATASAYADLQRVLNDG